MKLNQLLFSGLSRWIKSQLETLREVSHNPKCPIFQNTMVSNKIFGIEYKAPPLRVITHFHVNVFASFDKLMQTFWGGTDN